ncbi:coatomer subunit epsilon [Arctopsyche grandis]|uniref:coatomer subunit epsilon n=1 Tax=Arctopsyche grandis TaxID=121162 RepID=UPI00406D9374
MARQQQDVDEVFEVRNAFYIGNFQLCINEALNLKPSNSDFALERDAYMYRAYIAQKNYRIVLHEINNSSNPKLLPLKTLAEYFSNPSKGETIVSSIDEKVAKGSELSNDLFLITAATIYCHENNLEAALRVLHGTESLEILAYGLQVLLAFNRPDLARRHLKMMQDKDDDATLTQLAQAWLLLVQGGAKLQDAYYIYQELCDKFPMSACLGSGLAGAQAGRGSWPEAEAAALDALARDPTSADLLIAAAATAQQTGKTPEVTNRYISQVLDSTDKHPFIADYLNKEEEFKRLTSQYRPAIIN